MKPASPVEAGNEECCCVVLSLSGPGWSATAPLHPSSHDDGADAEELASETVRAGGGSRVANALADLV